MLFNSYEFIFVFLPLVFFIYFYLNRKRYVEASKAFLVFSSLFFYSWWNILYLPLILSSMLFNYIVGNILNGKKELKHKNNLHKKTILSIGVFLNILLLIYFKYTDFFIENVNYFTSNHIPTLDLALPLAISFFTFQQIAYLVDSYRQETQEYDFLNYALFVTFFPQLIAGPIVHHKEMMPQFASKWNKVKNYKNIALGLFIFTIGLFKKVVIADTFSIWATQGFDMAQTLTFLEAWITSLSYTFQLYFDFSGYTDMAIGTALLFNIKLPINFNSPYKALDIQDFWKRWHITLSRFLRDYIYIPLGGNRKGNFKTYTNLLATFIIGGLWHGAAWTFVFWGFLHGLALVVHRFWKKLGYNLNPIFAWFITFNFVNIAWIFFRAKNWDDAIKVLNGMFFGEIILPISLQNKLLFFEKFGVTFGEYIVNLSADKYTMVFLFIVLICILTLKNSIEMLAKYKATKFYSAFVVVAFLLAFYKLSGYSEFLYFRF